MGFIRPHYSNHFKRYRRGMLLPIRRSAPPKHLVQFYRKRTAHLIRRHAKSPIPKLLAPFILRYTSSYIYPLAQIPTHPILYAAISPKEAVVGEKVEVTITARGFKYNEDATGFCIIMLPAGEFESKNYCGAIDPDANGGRRVELYFRPLEKGLIPIRATLWKRLTMLTNQIVGEVRVLERRN
ncbi:MAG: hypothetical protein M1834_009015 [Cirrosporium novae-zelandiae]|nr:MAG: hypothetical protein M1834_009015 [Cirrosporium novae-zelandiae]